MKVSKIKRFPSSWSDGDINDAINAIEEEGWEIASFNATLNDNIIEHKPVITVLFQREY